MAKTILAIDLGTTNTGIYKKNVGVVLTEPTLLCVTENLGKTEIVACGLDAKKMQGKTNDELEFVSPIINGIISSLNLAESLLAFFLGKVLTPNEKFDLVFTVPCGLKEDEILNFKNLGYKLGANKVYLVPSVLTALMGAGVNINKASGVLSLNLGGGTIDMAICSLNQILKGYSIFFGGNKIDEAIKLYVNQFFDMQISNQTAEKLKIEAGSLFVHDLTNCEFSGVDINTKSPKTEVIDASSLRDTLEFYFQKVYMALKVLINNASPDIVSDLSINGIVVTGGLANLTGLENYLSKNLNLPVMISEDADNAVIIGAGKMIADEEYLKKVVELT
ncbi:MAG: rod shape-determining protein [Christensenellales bacterium]